MVVGGPAGEAAFPCSELEGFLAVELGVAHELVHAFGEALRGFAGAVGFGVVGRSDDESNFAASGALGERSGEFGEAAVAELFVDFGDFAGEAGVAVAENFEGVGDGFQDAMWRFVKNDGAILDAEAFESAAAFTTARGEEAGKEEFLVGHAGGGERGERGGRSRNGNDGNAMADAKGNETMAGVGDEGHTGVADESDSCALFEGEDEFGSASEFVVFVVADEGLVNVVVGEELLCVARVFAGDLVDFFQDAEGAQRDVLEIADGGADEIEAADGGAWRVALREFRVIGGLICGFRGHEASVARGGEAVGREWQE